MTRDIEADIRNDRAKVQPIAEKIWKMVKESDLNYREYKRLIDMLVNDGSVKFKMM